VPWGNALLNTLGDPIWNIVGVTDYNADDEHEAHPWTARF
jgi:hypothetical protein